MQGDEVMDATHLADEVRTEVTDGGGKFDGPEHWTDGTDHDQPVPPPVGIEYCGVRIDGGSDKND